MLLTLNNESSTEIIKDLELTVFLSYFSSKVLFLLWFLEIVMKVAETVLYGLPDCACENAEENWQGH